MKPHFEDPALQASFEKARELADQLCEQLKDEPVLAQLDALMAAYIKTGDAHGQLEVVAHGLLELGGGILFRCLNAKREARLSVPASAQPVDHHPAPSTRQ
ncbi:MAG: hypothetical protein ACKVOT_14235 [Polaromonas sp.]